jgi:cleavage and polyadenylation specificity factor subunit 3
MMRLKSKLLSLNADKASKVKIYSPANTEELRIPFKADLIAKVVGKLAQIPPPLTDHPDDAQLLAGVLVQKDFKLSLMAAEDLREYAGLTTTTITCKQRITLGAAGIGLVRWGLEGVFGSIEEIGLGRRKRFLRDGAVTENGHSDEAPHDMAPEEVHDVSVPVAYLVMGCIIVRHHPNGEVELEWEGNVMNDGIADAVLSVLLMMESSPAAVKGK